MKLYKHSDGTSHIWPEHIMPGMEFMIKADLSGQIWREIKKVENVGVKL